jgi:hypothetical protein
MNQKMKMDNNLGKIPTITFAGEDPPLYDYELVLKIQKHFKMYKKRKENKSNKNINCLILKQNKNKNDIELSLKDTVERKTLTSLALESNKEIYFSNSQQLVKANDIVEMDKSI